MGDLGLLDWGISKRAYYEMEVLSSIIHLSVYQMYWGYLGGISIEDGFGVTFLHYWISSSKIRIIFNDFSDIGAIPTKEARYRSSA